MRAHRALGEHRLALLDRGDDLAVLLARDRLDDRRATMRSLSRGWSTSEDQAVVRAYGDAVAGGCPDRSCGESGHRSRAVRGRRRGRELGGVRAEKRRTSSRSSPARSRARRQAPRAAPRGARAPRISSATEVVLGREHRGDRVADRLREAAVGAARDEDAAARPAGRAQQVSGAHEEPDRLANRRAAPRSVRERVRPRCRRGNLGAASAQRSTAAIAARRGRSTRWRSFPIHKRSTFSAVPATS